MTRVERVCVILCFVNTHSQTSDDFAIKEMCICCVNEYLKYTCTLGMNVFGFVIKIGMNDSY